MKKNTNPFIIGRIIFLMDKVTNPVTLEGDYLIDGIQVLSSGDNEHAMQV